MALSLRDYPALTPRRASNGVGRTVTPQERNAMLAEEMGDEAAAAMLREVSARMDTKRAEMSRFQDLCHRWDNLYYPDAITAYGPDHWPEDPNLHIPGRAHVSVNAYPVYVDVPASLQSVPPIENIAPADPRIEENRELAAAVERVYFAWKDEVDFEMQAHKAAVTKGLYGRTAAKVWWDDDAKRPALSIIDQPRNLWLGYSSTDYTRLDWAVYAYRVHPDTAMEEFGVDIARDKAGFPFVRPSTGNNLTVTRSGGTRDWLTGDDSHMVEVVDYWYKMPKNAPVKGQRTPMETCNAVLVGNMMVRQAKHPEYEGVLPFIPVFNTFIPGVPDGRSEFFDIEQLLREKDERLSAGAQMIAKAVGGQFWQLVGPEAPDKVPQGLEPQPDRTIAPGAGNRIEKIEPWMPQFQFDDYLDRLDRELADVSGLNDLLRGLAPAQVLSSGKAVNALVANYEARIRIKRDLFYKWRRQVWGLVVTVWSAKASELRGAFEQASVLSVKAPSLTPRDELETATLAANNVNAKLWSLRTGMDAVGVEDPEAEIDVIKEERTDASLFPADVQVQAALMSQLQQLQMTAQQMQAQQPPPQMGGGGAPTALNQLALQAAAAAPMGQEQMNGMGEGAVLPPEAMPANALSPGAAPPPVSGEGYNAVSQQMIREGEPTNRLLMQQPIGPPPPA